MEDYHQELIILLVTTHFGTGSFGGRADNFRFEISQRNLSKGTFTLVLRQGNDEQNKKESNRNF